MLFSRILGKPNNLIVIIPVNFSTSNRISEIKLCCIIFSSWSMSYLLTLSTMWFLIISFLSLHAKSKKILMNMLWRNDILHHDFNEKKYCNNENDTFYYGKSATIVVFFFKSWKLSSQNMHPNDLGSYCYRPNDQR